MMQARLSSPLSVERWPIHVHEPAEDAHKADEPDDHTEDATRGAKGRAPEGHGDPSRNDVGELARMRDIRIVCGLVSVPTSSYEADAGHQS
jgi:hypothetical protein